MLLNLNNKSIKIKSYTCFYLTVSSDSICNIKPGKHKIIGTIISVIETTFKI